MIKNEYYCTTFTDLFSPLFPSLKLIINLKPIYILNSKGDNNYLPFQKTNKNINK